MVLCYLGRVGHTPITNPTRLLDTRNGIGAPATANDVANTAGPLQAYAFGLIFYSGVKVLQPAFYTIDRRFIHNLRQLNR